MNDAAFGNMCAVLDLTRRDLFIQSSQVDLMSEFALPGASNLIEKLDACLGKSQFSTNPTNAQKAKW